MIAGGSLGLGFLAGVLSTLSPCVLPIVPIVVGGALAAHRLGAAALALGLAVSYLAIGLFVAVVGFEIGLDGELFCTAGGVLLLLFGILLLSAALQRRFLAAASPLAGLGERFLQKVQPSGLGGQFVLGLLLGAVWSPCVGPTLGAAATLAAQGSDLGSVAATMALFALGASLPLLLVAAVGREVMLRWRSRLAGVGRWGKSALGALLVVGGLGILTGIDHRLEAVLTGASPDWLTDLTTRY